MKHDFAVTPEEFAVIVEMRRQRNTIARNRQPMVFGYVRCSNKESGKSGLSPLDQRRQINAWRQFLIQDKPNLQLGEIFEDVGQTGSLAIGARRGGRELLLVVQPGDHIVFARLDRGFRNARDQLNMTNAWDQRGITYHSCDLRLDTSSAGGRLVVGMMAIWNQYELEKLTEKNQAMAEARRRKTRSKRLANGDHDVIGCVKRGPRGKRYPAPQADQQKWMDDIVDMVEGGISLRNVAYVLNEKVRLLAENGEPRKSWRDKHWTFQRVDRWFKRGLELARLPVEIS